MKTKNITILLPAGRISHELLAKSNELAIEHKLGIYLTTYQNLRLTDVPETVVQGITDTLSTLGAKFKAPGVFSPPRVCVGKPHCDLAVTDPEILSTKILERFATKTFTKPKVKIAIAACPASCSGAKTTDIGIISTRNGFDVFVGGKGGGLPTIGKCILKNSTEEELLSAVETLIEFHDSKTEKKQRLIKILKDPDFPFTF